TVARLSGPRRLEISVPMTFAHAFRDDHVEGLSEHLRRRKAENSLGTTVPEADHTSDICVDDRIGRFVGKRPTELVDVGVHWAAAGARAARPIKARPLRIGRVAVSRQSPSDGDAPNGVITASRLARAATATCPAPSGARTTRHLDRSLLQS